MTRQIPEEDWKIYKIIFPKALDRICERVLDEIEEIRSQEGPSNHEKYLQIYKLIKKSDRNIGNIFNDYRRSTALIRLGQMNSFGLLTPQEIGELSEETQALLKFLS
ncbi:MAG TPA: hypothetical protein VKZ54_05975 [Membranihabitans sp.]|nr:hypothetical protein [Membranihabitans sp.]